MDKAPTKAERPVDRASLSQPDARATALPPTPWIARDSRAVDENNVAIIRVVDAAGADVWCAINPAGSPAIPFPSPYHRKMVAIADLIAAGPELLEALQMVCDSGVALAEPIESAMLAALKKARGE